MRGPWTEKEIRWFLVFNGAHSAEDLAAKSGRTKPAIMGMRRKLKRLRELGAKADKLWQLLSVSNDFVDTHTLAQIRRRALEEHVLVRQFVRHSRYRKPYVVAAHKRNKETP